ncbi:unnamed protein product [Allacma fusca]|uniref:Uncharacterized protein n=1 Tax=Allacma fusca TaxID=39272 RepID=A0A8J2PBL9_9HEXA|nr:unnamed protein product [Allacma fusca]
MSRINYIKYLYFKSYDLEMTIVKDMGTKEVPVLKAHSVPVLMKPCHVPCGHSIFSFGLPQRFRNSQNIDGLLRCTSPASCERNNIVECGRGRGGSFLVKCP